MRNQFFVDFHCHPALKPLGKSFNGNRVTGRNNQNHKKNNSIYHQIKPNFFKKIINLLSTLTKFTQTDIKTLIEGNVHVITASMYTVEKGFLINKSNQNILSELLSNLAMGVGKSRIDFVQGHEDYFKDLELEYKFYKELDNKTVKIDNQNVQYKIVNDFSEINFTNNSNTKIVYIVLSIEGLHCLNTGLKGKESQCNPNEVIDNIEKIKSWNHKVLFVTFAHHFWNELCGHAASFSGIVDRMADQGYGLDKGITPLGYKVIENLLDNQNGNRILIDVKHMNYQSRKDYYRYLKENYPEFDIPIIVSHGALNGLNCFEKQQNLNPTGKYFLKKEINFFDNEILKVAKSKGLFCFQLDERRLIDNIKRVPKSLTKRGMLKNRSRLLWNQIQHFVEILDQHGVANVWDYMAIGSDFDGIINPLNGFWTAKETKSLYENLVKHSKEYHNSSNFRLNKENSIDPKLAMDKIFRLNALNFLERNFKSNYAKANSA